MATLEADVMVRVQLGTTETTAQITPAAFTRGMAEEATARGAECLIGEVTGIALDWNGTVLRGVEVDGCLREAEAVVIATIAVAGVYVFMREKKTSRTVACARPLRRA